MANNTNVIILKGCLSEKPNKYPTIEENTTLIAKPAFVISLKSLINVLKELFNFKNSEILRIYALKCCLFILLIQKVYANVCLDHSKLFSSIL